MSSAIVAIFIFISVAILCLVSLAVSVITIVGYWKVFEKAGKPGWAAIIPYYNQWVLYEISGYSPFLIFINIGVGFVSVFTGVFSAAIQYNEIFAIPFIIFDAITIIGGIVALVFSILVSLNLAKKFEKSSGYGVGLAFLPFIFYPMLGFDKKAVYNKEA